ncbi:MAG: DUF2207 domain-containing protein [Solirubrobacterales bacterium]|nr:DUF2207 domain-containing protein [Solirubrobacterales bacterium]MCB8969872.1 DUF2207 domain-containing protein [Thermoleophilales bacterium]MCO5327471.1 DUF2207 domain-containing protein [Solirubrobacterales bacterium]
MKKLAAGGFTGRMIFVVILAAAAWAGFTFIPDIPTQEKQYEIDNADVDVQLQRDGSLLVHESLDFDFQGSFSGAYRDIPLNGGARITGMRVLSGGQRYKPGAATGLGSYDVPGSFGTEEFGGTSDFDGAGDASRDRHYVRVVWHYSAESEHKTFDLVYRVTGATNVRDDVVDVTWSIWGDQWDFWLNDLDATFSSASGVAPTHTWLRPRSLGSEPEIEGDAAVASVSRVPEGEAVGMRAVFPRDAISSTTGAEVDRGDGLDEIESEEASLDDQLSATTKLRNWISDNVLLVSILLGLFALACMALLTALARERPTDVPEYLPEPPEDIPPALGYQLAREGTYSDRLVLATLMDLVDRGFYEAKAAPGSDLDLEVHKCEERPDATQLQPYEVTVMDFFDNLLGSNWVAIGKMKDEVPRHSSVWRARWETMNNQLDEAEHTHVSWDRDMTGWRELLTAIVALLFVGVIVAAWTRTQRVPVPVAAMILTVGFLLSVPKVWLKRLAAEPRRRSAQWQSFERWTKDFPRLHDDPPATLELWRRILVYAVAFGTAERIAKSGRIPPPVTEAAASDVPWTAYAFHSGSFGGSFNSFGSGFSSQVAPQSSSSGGGGFSGGGGGGFSGGGGGGAW